MKIKINEMTLKQVSDYYCSTKCDIHCNKDSYCPLHAGNCCLCDIVGFKNDRNINELYKTQLGIEFNENLKVKDVMKAFIEKEVVIDEEED